MARWWTGKRKIRRSRNIFWKLICGPSRCCRLCQQSRDWSYRIGLWWRNRRHICRVFWCLEGLGRGFRYRYTRRTRWRVGLIDRIAGSKSIEMSIWSWSIVKGAMDRWFIFNKVFLVVTSCLWLPLPPINGRCDLFGFRIHVENYA